jgi:hypothetical protein
MATGQAADDAGPRRLLQSVLLPRPMAEARRPADSPSRYSEPPSMPLFQSRSSRSRSPALLALLFLLLIAGLLAAPLGAAQPPEPPAGAPRPAQAEARIHLPLIVGAGDPAPDGAPVIEAFQLDAAAGPMAAEVELRWRVRGATGLQIEPGVGDALGAASAIVYPIATTIYTLTASNEQGSATATATYTVNGPPTPNPLTVSAQPDGARAVAASIGVAGGVVEATGADGARYTLAVPPDALPHTEAITLTPVAAIDGMPFAAASVRAVSIAPEGLLFVEPATLTITPPAPAAAPHTAGFAFQGAGAEFHLRALLGAGAAELAQAGAPASLSVTTARSYGAAEIADDDLLAPLVQHAPSDPADSAEHVYITALDESLNATARRVRLLQHLRDDFELGAGTQLVSASNNPEAPAPFDLESAVRSYISWRARVRQAGLEEQLRSEISQANLLLGEALRKAGELATERCNQGRPAQGFALQRYMGYAKRFGLENTRGLLEERLASCWVFRLSFQSHMDQQDGDVRMLYELKAAVRLNYQPGGRMVGSAPLGWERFDVTPPDDCALTNGPHEGSTFKADGEGLGLRLEPVSRSSPDVSFSLSYQVGQPIAKWTFTCDDLTIPYTSPFWWVAYGQTHLDERQGDTYTARAQGVNPNSFSGWVYDIPIPGGLGNEHTEIRLEHAPGS